MARRSFGDFWGTRKQALSEKARQIGVWAKVQALPVFGMKFLSNFSMKSSIGSRQISTGWRKSCDRRNNFKLINFYSNLLKRFVKIFFENLFID